MRDACLAQNIPDVFLLLVIVALPGTAMSRAVPFKTIDRGEMSYYLYTGL
jgi:hypothetical protein